MDRKKALPIALLALAVLGLTTFAVAAERFTDNGDGTVTDHELGLMWAKADNQGDIDWHDAKRWTEFTFQYTIATYYDDWRLPTVAELESLISQDERYAGYETDCGLNVLVVREFELSCAWVWTSEEHSVTARLFNFKRGLAHSERKAKTRGLRALPVRNLK
jgi:hypothetical protein